MLPPPPPPPLQRRRFPNPPPASASNYAIPSHTPALISDLAPPFVPASAAASGSRSAAASAPSFPAPSQTILTFAQLAAAYDALPPLQNRVVRVTPATVSIKLLFYYKVYTNYCMSLSIMSTITTLASSNCTPTFWPCLGGS